MDKKIKRRSIMTSFIIGGPIGLLTIFVFLMLPGFLSGEGLATMLMVAVYGKAIIGLVISFFISLWFAGKNAYNDFLKNRKLLFVSFKYSLFTNIIIWTTFILITIFDNIGQFNWNYIAPPFFAFILCTAITTFTIGLLICYLIKQQILGMTIKYI
jgi:hypothetical protein